MAQELGADVPLHFTAFHPDYKLDDLPPTPPATLTRARNIAMGEGLKYVYTGNVHDREGGSTRCPNCGEALIVRDWHHILLYRISADGRCIACKAPISGRFGKFEIPFGPKRIPVSIGG